MENTNDVLRSDTGSGVRDRKEHVPVFSPRAHVDAAAVRCELHGVRQEVHEDLLHLPLIGVDRADARFDVLRKRDGMLRRALADERDRTTDGVGDGEGRALELEPARFDLRQIEDVVDERELMLAG